MNAKISQELHLFEWYRALFCANCVTDRLSCQACSALLSQSKKKKSCSIYYSEKSLLSNTFPKLDNPLCSGLPPALSTFEQSALGKWEKGSSEQRKWKELHCCCYHPPFLHTFCSSTGELVGKEASRTFGVWPSRAQACPKVSTVLTDPQTHQKSGMWGQASRRFSLIDIEWMMSIREKAWASDEDGAHWPFWKRGEKCPIVDGHRQKSAA